MLLFTIPGNHMSTCLLDRSAQNATNADRVGGTPERPVDRGGLNSAGRKPCRVGSRSPPPRSAIVDRCGYDIESHSILISRSVVRDVPETMHLDEH